MSKKHLSEPVTGRFAPSPTGPLHLGSLVTAVGSYCLARLHGGRWLVRMEDLDTPRVVPGAANDILFTLESFGLHWDDEVVYQSSRSALYEAALEKLRQQGLVFPCACSRKEVLASAPHAGEEGPIYPGTCRRGLPSGRKARAMRIRVPETMVCFQDGVFGPCDQCLSSTVGDFVLRRADGLFAYQLAVVVDDAEAGVNQLVRGADLLSSTPRQIFLQTCLGYPTPAYIHLPLALAPDGEKISKRNGPVPLDGSLKRGAILWQVLHFLGQDIPFALRKGTPREVLDWGARHFDILKVPKDSRVLELMSS